MGKLKYQLIGTAFELLSRSGICAITQRLSRAKGIIFTLHRVLPEPPAAFAPNGILQVTPDFLEQVIIKARRRGFDIVSMDEAVARIKSDEKTKPFIVLSFDDAYRDNLTYALPVLKAQNCPFTLYVPTAFVDGEGELWWQALEDVIARNDTISVSGEVLKTETLDEKNAAFANIYWKMRDMPEPDRVQLIRDLATTYDFDLKEQCRSLVMDWGELEAFASEPLCTIGAHTVHHYELAKLSETESEEEMRQSAIVLAEKLGRKPAHLSYPIGRIRAAGPREFALAQKLGFTTGVTTAPSGLYSRHRNRLSNLPRISLNGLYQNPRYIDVFLTATLFSLLDEKG